jgi:hypothetical protein
MELVALLRQKDLTPCAFFCFSKKRWGRGGWSCMHGCTAVHMCSLASAPRHRGTAAQLHGCMAAYQSFCIQLSAALSASCGRSGSSTAPLLMRVPCTSWCGFCLRG